MCVLCVNMEQDNMEHMYPLISIAEHLYPCINMEQDNNMEHGCPLICIAEHLYSCITNIWNRIGCHVVFYGSVQYRCSLEQMKWSDWNRIAWNICVLRIRTK